MSPSLPAWSPLKLLAEVPTKSRINSIWVDGRYFCVMTEAGEFFRFDEVGALQREGKVCRPAREPRALKHDGPAIPSLG